MTEIAYSKPGSQGPVRPGNPLVLYAALMVGSMLLIGAVAVATVL